MTGLKCEPASLYFPENVVLFLVLNHPSLELRLNTVGSQHPKIVAESVQINHCHLSMFGQESKFRTSACLGAV